MRRLEGFALPDRIVGEFLADLVDGFNDLRNVVVVVNLDIEVDVAMSHCLINDVGDCAVRDEVDVAVEVTNSGGACADMFDFADGVVDANYVANAVLVFADDENTTNEILD